MKEEKKGIEDYSKRKGAAYHFNKLKDSSSSLKNEDVQLLRNAENYSGLDMSDVSISYNSNHPLQLNAHAYVQGTDIHVGKGQEQHIAHEIGHVIQQKQGRVKNEQKFKGFNINQDQSLEVEADELGEKISKNTQLNQTKKPAYTYQNPVNQPVQRKEIKLGDDESEEIIKSFQGERDAELKGFQNSGIVKRNSPNISNRVKEQGSALKIHDQALKDEASGGNKTIHGRSRHGFQTGFEGQIERAKSKKTPDQDKDPMGLGRTSESWTTSKGIEKVYAKGSVKASPINEGDAVVKSEYDSIASKNKRKPAKARKSGGPYAGSFFSPEHQNQAEKEALAQAQLFSAWDLAEFQSNPGNFEPIVYFDVVVNSKKGGYGVAFSKGKGEESENALKIEDPTITEGKPGIDTYLMKSAHIQLKKTEDGWQILSSFPENLPPGASPIKNHGEDKWTGRIQSSKTKTIGSKKTPNW